MHQIDWKVFNMFQNLYETNIMLISILSLTSFALTCNILPCIVYRNERGHGKNYSITCASSEDSDQHARSRSLIWIIAGSSELVTKDPKFRYADSKDWLDGAEAQAGVSLRCTLICVCRFSVYWLKCLQVGCSLRWKTIRQNATWAKYI